MLLTAQTINYVISLRHLHIKPIDTQRILKSSVTEFFFYLKKHFFKFCKSRYLLKDID